MLPVMFSRRLHVAMMNLPLQSVCPMEASDTKARVMTGSGAATLMELRGGTPGINGEVGPGIDPGTEAARSEGLAGLRVVMTTVPRPR